MFDDISENYKTQTADNKRKAGAIARATRMRAAPPELLTRDHVARCIVGGIKAGRGITAASISISPGSRVSFPTARNTSKLPSMYTSSNNWLTSTSQEPMEVGPTTHS